jgi:NADH pyrophosphatase NudC (nudix superfamily)
MGFADRLGVQTGTGMVATDAPQVPSFSRGSAGAAAAATPAPASSARANKYGGKCVDCNGWVEAGAGLLAKDAAGKWAAQHIECPDVAPVAPARPSNELVGIVGASFVMRNKLARPCEVCGKHVEEKEGHAARIDEEWITYCYSCARTDPAVAAARKAAEERMKDELQAQVEAILATAYPTDERQVPTIRVAIPSEGDNDLDFLVVQVAQNGVARILRTLGGQGDTIITVAEQARHAARLVSFDQDALHAAAAVYGREMGYCGRCGRELTNKASRDAGIGPECSKMH